MLELLNVEGGGGLTNPYLVVHGGGGECLKNRENVLHEIIITLIIKIHLFLPYCG